MISHFEEHIFSNGLKLNHQPVVYSLRCNRDKSQESFQGVSYDTNGSGIMDLFLSKSLRQVMNKLRSIYFFLKVSLKLTKKSNGKTPSSSEIQFVFLEIIVY